MNGIKTIVGKELTRVFKDKKMIFSLFILPIVMIVGMYTLIGSMTANMMNDIEEHIPFVYLQNAPEQFNEYMASTEFNAEIQYIDSDFDTVQIKNGILNGKVDLLVEFEDGFLDKIQYFEIGSSIPQVKTYYNPSENYSNEARSKFIELVLTPYKDQLLTARVGNLDYISVFGIDSDNPESIIMNEQRASGKALGMMLPYLITILLFSGAMSLGVDSITGEKERGTLASMLITPLKRSEIVFGKIISLTILSCMSAAVYVIAMSISMPAMLNTVSNGVENISVHFSFVQVLQLLVIMLSLVFLYVNIVSLAAVYAKTAKEAGTYVTPLYLIVIVAGLLTMFQGDSKPELIYYFIPVYGNAISIQALLIGELTSAQLIGTIVGTLGTSCILSAIITKAFNSEKVMFNA